MPALQIRMSDVEHEAVRSAAERAGLSMSEYVRKIALDPEGAQDSDQSAFRYAVSDHEQRIAELEAWHERSREMLKVYEAAGWKNPLEHPEADRPIRMDQFKRASEIRRQPMPKK